MKFNWRVFPGGQLLASQDTTSAVLDTSTVTANWAIVSVDFADFRKCSWSSSSGDINIGRKDPYTRADAFWWWFQLNSERFRAYKDPEYKEWLVMLETWLQSVDPRLTFRIDHHRPDPLNKALIVDSKPFNANILNEFIARAPSLAGWEIITAKPPSKTVSRSSKWAAAERIRPATKQEVKGWLNIKPGDAPFAEVCRMGSKSLTIVGTPGAYSFEPA